MKMVTAYLRARGHKGRANAVKQEVIQADIGISRREMRAQIDEINGDLNIKDMVSFCNDGIYLVTSNEELRTIRSRAKRAVQRNRQRIQKADILLNEQTQLTFGFEWDGNTVTHQ